MKPNWSNVEDGACIMKSVVDSCTTKQSKVECKPDKKRSRYSVMSGHDCNFGMGGVVPGAVSKYSTSVWQGWPGHCVTSGSVGLTWYSIPSEVCSRARRRIISNTGNIEVLEYITVLDWVEKFRCKSKQFVHANGKFIMYLHRYVFIHSSATTWYGKYSCSLLSVDKLTKWVDLLHKKGIIRFLHTK